MCNILQLSLHFLNTHLNDLLPIFCFLCRYNDGYSNIFAQNIIRSKKNFFPEKHCSKKIYLDCTLVEKKTWIIITLMINIKKIKCVCIFIVLILFQFFCEHPFLGCIYDSLLRLPVVSFSLMPDLYLCLPSSQFFS